MKRCPSCDRDFEDDSLGFCPHDGAGLVSGTSSAPVELQATMMAPPPSLGSGSYPPPSEPVRPDSGSFNQPPTNASAGVNSSSPNQPWPNQQTAANPSWATPDANEPQPPRKSGLASAKILIGAVGCLGMGLIAVVVGVLLLSAFSGPASKMNPYKGDLKDLAPEKAGAYTRVDMDVLKDKDKEGFDKVREALGLAYKGDTDATVRMFIGRYDSAEDAEDGLRTYKETKLNKFWTIVDEGSKKVGWRTVGKRYVASSGSSTSNINEGTLQDGGTMVSIQSASPARSELLKIVCWTNGSVIFCAVGEDDSALTFEKAFDSAAK